MNKNEINQFIDNDDDLAAFCATIQNEPWIAIDTEFHRDQNYYPDLCLLQIGTLELAVCIDPLKINNLDPLLDILYQPGITKVMHAGRQDLEIFFHMRGEVPKPIFDTQIAAPLLGLDDQMGYGGLVKAMLDVSLDKNHSRADWMRRPLPQAQMQYALDDVIYLAQLYPKMQQQLADLNRLNWLEEDFAELTSASLYQNSPENAWLRIKAARKLKPRQLAVLQSLAAWRESFAQEANKPRGWICKDDILIDMSKLMPSNQKELSHIRGIGDGFANRHGEKLIGLINSAKNDKPIPYPDHKIRQKQTPEESAQLDALSAILTLCAYRNQIHPSAIATRKQLEALLRNEDTPLRHGWRFQLAGEMLKSFLNGSASLQIDKGKLEINQ